MSSALHLGAGIYDITGPAAEAGMFGYAKAGQSTSGIHMRLRSRAFVFHYLPTNTFLAFASVDVGAITEVVTRSVLEKLQDHLGIPDGTFENASNLLLSATHTHCSPGGLSHYLLYNMHPPLKGFDQQNFDVVVSGIVESIYRAYVNKQPGFIRMARGECHGASINRSIEAYNANPQDERDKYLHDTDKEMVLWRLDGENGFPMGMINWFAVHPTSMGSWFTLITGDNKGLASHLFECDHGTNHLMDKPRSFVAAFAQTNEGDVSPNISGPRDEAGSEGDYDRMTLVASKQYECAKELYEQAASQPPITGPLAVTHQYVDYGNIALNTTFHEYKECTPNTCGGCLGISMLSGTFFDGRGIHFLKEGIKWGDYPKLFTLVPELQKHQKEKPVGFPTAYYGLTPTVLPLQLVVLGEVAIVAIPFEATTMAGRRLRDSVTNSLNEVGVTSTIIAGLSNAYCGYLTTREEFAVQRYEGASTHFGPNQLSATKQQFDILAKSLIHGCQPDTISPPEVRFGTANFNISVIHDGISASFYFGEVVKGKDVKEIYYPGEVVECQFHGAHPKNNLRTQGTFLEISRLNIDHNIWVLQYDDGDESTRYMWSRNGLDRSTVAISWTIPSDIQPGIYRIKHNGDYKTAWKSEVESYQGVSSRFEVVQMDSNYDGPEL